MYPPVFRVDCLYICSVFDFFGEHVKNRSFLYLALSFAVFCFFACGFDSDGESQSVNSWLSSQGMPSSYKVNVLEISDLPIVSSEVFHSSKPMSGYVTLSHQHIMILNKLSLNSYQSDEYRHDIPLLL